MKNVYVVIGQCGEYSSHSEWGVRAFLDKDVAEDYAFRATKEAKRLERLYKADYKQWERANPDDIHAPGRPDTYKDPVKYGSALDPEFHADAYAGTDYFVMVLPMDEGA